jgi:hypothetical protein|tara:strand:+ start:3548 stop:4021 length:474 start_codon:yes stop_codon:yes gene_type:complete
MEIYGQGQVFEVSDILTGKFPKVQMEGGQFPGWKIDWKGDGDMPVKGAKITWSGQREEGSDGKQYWKMYDWEYAKSDTKTNGGAQHITKVLPTINQPVNQPVQVNSALTKEASMFVMGTVGRWVGNQKDFPQQEELTGMIQNAKHAYLKGMKNDSES